MCVFVCLCLCFFITTKLSLLIIKKKSLDQIAVLREEKRNQKEFFTTPASRDLRNRVVATEDRGLVSAED